MLININSQITSFLPDISRLFLLKFVLITINHAYGSVHAHDLYIDYDYQINTRNLTIRIMK